MHIYHLTCLIVLISVFISPIVKTEIICGPWIKLWKAIQTINWRWWKVDHFSQYLKKVTQKRDWKKWDQIKKLGTVFFREDFPQGSKQASHSLSIINSTWLNIFLTVNLATLPKLGVLLKKLKMLFNIFHKSFVYGHSNGQDVLVNFITIILSCSPSS